MSSNPPSGKMLTLEGLAAARSTTDSLSAFLKGRLESYLIALRPLFAPSRVFGAFQERRGAIGSSHAFKTLKERFKEAGGAPFNLRRDLDEGALSALGSLLALEPWEYDLEMETDGARRKVRVTSPVKWILTYKCELTLPRLRKILEEGEERRADPIREFVVNGLAMCMFFESHPQLKKLFSDLRYNVSLEAAPGLGSLRLVTISSCLSSYLPPDAMILKTTQFSGVPAFIELIDVGGIGAIEDPMSSGLREIAGGG